VGVSIVRQSGDWENEGRSRRSGPRTRYPMEEGYAVCRGLRIHLAFFFASETFVIMLMTAPHGMMP
jgi:hypothetical protein